MTRDESLRILQHALGLDEYGLDLSGRSPAEHHRNYTVAEPGSYEWGLCVAHVDAGRMTRHGPSSLYGGNGSYCFVVTAPGIAYVREHSPKPPVRPLRGKRLEQRIKRGGV